MAAEPLSKVQAHPPELHIREITTAAANVTKNIELPPGFYNLRIFGSQTNAGADATILVQKYANEAQSVVADVYGEDGATAAGIATAIDIEAANAFVDLWFLGTAAEIPPLTVFIPYGLKITFVINAATAMNISLAALRIAGGV